MIEITEQMIDPPTVLAAVHSHAAGAAVLFLGTVRELTAGRRTIALDYECYPEMALAEMQRIADEASAKWPDAAIAMVHRVGHLELGEISVAVAAATPHRGTAFDAARYLIEEVKARVPIWKKENWDNGETEWVHPGLGTPRL